MPRDSSKDPPRSAADLIADLQLDSAFQQRAAYTARQIERNRQSYGEAAEGLVLALRDRAGIRKKLSELTEEDLASAGTVLVEWLPRIQYLPLKTEVIHALGKTGKAFNPSSVLLSELRNTASAETRWAIASALSNVATDTEFDEISSLAQDRRLGKAREMLTLALRNMDCTKAAPVLVSLLRDEETVGHAVMALGELKAIEARADIEAALENPKAWIRNEARKALELL